MTEAVELPEFERLPEGECESLLDDVDERDADAAVLAEMQALALAVAEGTGEAVALSVGKVANAVPLLDVEPVSEALAETLLDVLAQREARPLRELLLEKLAL